MLVAPIEGVAYNPQSCQIMFSNGSSIWPGSSTKLMPTTEIPGISTHYNQVLVMQRFLISWRKEAMEMKSRLYCRWFTKSFSEKIIVDSVLVSQLFQ